MSLFRHIRPTGLGRVWGWAGMSPRRRRLIRRYLVVGLSLLAHGAVLGGLARSPSNRFAVAPSSPLLSVELVRPSPLDRQATRSPAGSAPIAAPRLDARPATTGGVTPSLTSSVSPVTSPSGSPGASSGVMAPDKLQAALRAGAGCSSHSLSREEREKCQEKLGRLSASAPSYDAPIDPGKRAYFDEVAAAGPSGSVSRDAAPGGVTPGSAYVTIFKCSVTFGVGQKPKDRQGTVRLRGTPCAVPLQGSFFTPEATVRKR